MTREIDNEWEEFCAGTLDTDVFESAPEHCVAPESTPLYISTKTKICHLSTGIDLSDVFWKLPVTPYYEACEGIIKKQMKFNSASEEESMKVDEQLTAELAKQPNHFDNQILSRVVNPEGLIKYKNIRKISIGLNKKDIINFRCKKKSAFYNCFVAILRIFHADTFKEINVKVFNTGKLEIPGIREDDVLEQTLCALTKILTPIIGAAVTYAPTNETVLINSNFKCNYLINRDQLVDILTRKYGIKCSYDPCSYPGIQCMFFYDPDKEFQTGVSITAENITRVSFMIFRTGSVLIVGKCTEPVLDEIYQFIRILLETEYSAVREANTPDMTDGNEKIKHVAVRKKRRRKITM